MGRKKKSESPEEMRDKILKIAEEKGVSEEYFFRTTFERYEMQLTILSRLKETIDSDKLLVEKTYVKDRTNLAINPAISEYNKTASAAKGTVTTLFKILNSIPTSKSDQPGDLMRDFLNT